MILEIPLSLLQRVRKIFAEADGLDLRAVQNKVIDSSCRSGREIYGQVEVRGLSGLHNPRPRYLASWEHYMMPVL